jgi:hypothetical protein
MTSSRASNAQASTSTRSGRNAVIVPASLTSHLDALKQLADSLPAGHTVLVLSPAQRRLGLRLAPLPRVNGHGCSR